MYEFLRPNRRQVQTGGPADRRHCNEMPWRPVIQHIGRTDSESRWRYYHPLFAWANVVTMHLAELFYTAFNVADTNYWVDSLLPTFLQAMIDSLEVLQVQYIRRLCSIVVAQNKRNEKVQRLCPLDKVARSAAAIG